MGYKEKQRLNYVTNTHIFLATFFFVPIFVQTTLKDFDVYKSKYKT